jgi:hypothetical protein
MSSECQMLDISAGSLLFVLQGSAQEHVTLIKWSDFCRKCIVSAIHLPLYYFVSFFSSNIQVGETSFTVLDILTKKLMALVFIHFLVDNSRRGRRRFLLYSSSSLKQCEMNCVKKRCDIGTYTQIWPTRLKKTKEL